MSAWLRPACGHAPATLSIFTPSAGRLAAAGLAAGRPVSGSTPPVATGAEAVAEVAGALDPAETSALAAGAALAAAGAELGAADGVEDALVQAALNSRLADATAAPQSRVLERV